jgi:hypothetical protein
MDNTAHLTALSQHFSREALNAFLRAASGGFRPESEDLSRQVENAPSIGDLFKLGQIDFGDGQRLVVLAGQVENELTSQSGKQKQYEIARKVLQQHYYDAGIFVFHDAAGHFRFSLITAQYQGAKREFSNFRRYTYFVAPDQSARTFIERIGRADFSSIEKILDAFSVEPVTREFFQEYRKIFEEAEAKIASDWGDEQKRLYTQRFFNRMMFIAFLERKGWLRFEAASGRKDYLRALYTDYLANEGSKRAGYFHKSRLNTLFFRGLNSPQGDRLQSDPHYKMFRDLIGDVPYLNGGLFDEEPEDIDGPLFPDAVVAKILGDLVYKFNFTVTESTPLDIEVAVDPEMLGRIFEELVTGRHETGSYYTPKPVVAFMCREALKGYLGAALPGESAASLARFVDQNNPEDLRNPELTLGALKAVKVCDPACGSGAYLLGMLHELLEQRECLFAVRQLDAKTIYERKLEIIQNNLYGVDLDPFAVNIARLRLWLSLIVDFEGDIPLPLPNLDFKIEQGDSLTAPDPSGGLQPDLLRYTKIKEFLRLKNKFIGIHDGKDKKEELLATINAARAEIASGIHIKKFDGFDWQVDFAEVFAPELAESILGGKMAGLVNTTKGQIEMTAAPKEGGFDIVLANPPYGATVDSKVRDIYFNPKTESGQSKDTYGLFIARGLQLLRNDGQFCFIVSDTWRTIKSHKPLRKKLLETTIAHVIDLPSWVFNATVNTCILTLSKRAAPDNHNVIASELRGIKPGDWKTLADNLNAVATHGIDVQTIEFARYTYTQKLISAFENLPFFVGSPKLYRIMINKSLVHLETIADVKVGLQTGKNEYYLRKRAGARGSYKILEEDKLLSEKEISKLSAEEKENGVDPSKYSGHHFIPYDKGGESDAQGGWLPNYYVPTQYFIDWSKKSVDRLRTYCEDPKNLLGKAVFRNEDYYFHKGISFSDTGFYAPTFRYGSAALFDVMGMTVFPEDFSIDVLIAILSSKVVKYLIKNYINHTVHTQVDGLKLVPIPSHESNIETEIQKHVSQIVEAQKKNSRYLYYLHEQKAIDELICQLYELNEDDIREIELWYCRRYPLLAKAQGILEKVEQKYVKNSAL